ncbi:MULTISPECIES: aminotransferase class I/II-fold pyridoxal phosphate-dependent enzyme [Aliivibrio]|nr:MULTISPECIES: aminotransferase class I/II-fold pyridoxal phosphate-dependent enzyme [Aliivibrio]MDD9180556.1 aminotransferase class I/II-fold pyridoxal phosphate-dependent enzyme [Aliivibrio sp. A6]
MEIITSAIHQRIDCLDDSHSEAIALTSAYDFNSASEAANRFSGVTQGNIYSRFTNPSVDLFERKLATFEGAEASVAFSSGMSAYLAIAITFLKQGDHVLLASGIFGTTTHLFRQYFGRFGITASVVDVDDINGWKKELQHNTKLIVVETPTNPILAVADIKQLSLIAKEQKAIFVVDNTLLSPVFQQPLAFGADLVLHSVGKFIDGQGRVVGGAISGSYKLIQPLKDYLRSSGTCLSAFNAWLLSKSMDTLYARMQQHQSNAIKVYNWLKVQDMIVSVNSTIDPEHSQAILISEQQKGHSPILTFSIKGGRIEAWKIIDSFELISRCTNIGDAKTMVTHPATTTHGKYTIKERERYGITENLIRLSIGLENPKDIIDDLNKAFDAIKTPICSDKSEEYDHVLSL